MSFNICALSGIIVENPVVSKKTGHIFEKRLIEKHIDATGRCPISKLELGQDDLVLIKVDKKIKPRLVNQASMSGLFSELQSEWDKIITETFTCKTELDAAKKELAHILYQSDAATRVICNLIKERDLAREALANYRDEFEEIDEEGLAGEEFDNMGMYSELIERITETTFKLIADRKSRKQSESFANFEQMSKYESKFSTFPLAKLQNEGANTNPTGITCSDLNKNHSNYMIAGCNNGTTAFLEINSEGKVIELKSHKKINGSNVNDIEFYPSANYLAFGACYDNNTASFFNLNTDGDIVEKYRIKSHLESMTGISFHPLQDYAFLSSLDGYWSFHNLFKGVCIHKEYCGYSIKTIKTHPDGGIFATGNSKGPGRIQLWDISSQKPFLDLKDEGMDYVNSVSFSENGIHLASCSEEDKVVRVWDIRKGSVVNYINLPEKRSANKVQFDPTGNYLSIAGHSQSLYNTKTSELVNYKCKDASTSLNFDKTKNQFLVSTSIDGEIRLFA